MVKLSNCTGSQNVSYLVDNKVPEILFCHSSLMKLIWKARQLNLLFFFFKAFPSVP